MHIGFIEDTMLRGGTQIWVVEAVKNFIKKGEDVTVIQPEGSFVANACRRVGARVFTYCFEDISKHPNKYQNAWMNELAPCDVAVVTVHPPREGFHSSVFAEKCIREGQLDTVLLPKTGSIVPWYKREYYQIDSGVKSRVICSNRFAKKYLEDVYKIPPEKIMVLYQGTEVNRFTPTLASEVEAKYRCPLTQSVGPILGSVGAMEHRKGQVILLQAVKHLHDNHKLPNIHLMFVGEGPDEKKLKAVTRAYGLDPYVSFFPYTRDPKYIFDRIDILALPSLYKEGLPNVLLEAMSMKVPVIATNIAGIPEVVFNNETGLLVEPGNVKQLSEAIEKLWESPDMRKSMGVKSRQLIQKKMDKQRQFDSFLHYFKKVSGK